MAHPMHDDVKSSKESKLRKLSGAHGTVDNPSGNKSAPREIANGPMKAMGYGVEGAKSKGKMGRFAHGGAVKHKGKGTNVNIIIGQPGGAGAAPQAGPSIMPPHMPMAAPPPPPPMMPPGGPGASPGGPAMPPGAPPPGMMHKRGGAAYKRGGKVYDAGAASGEGRLEKVAAYGKNSKKPAKAV